MECAFIALKGPKARYEVNEAIKAIKLLGGGDISVDDIKLPLVDEGRVVIKIMKCHATPVLYPRKAGIPERQPLK